MGKLYKRGRLWLLACLAMTACGCSGQDADQLARVSQRVVARLEAVSGGATGKLLNRLQVRRSNETEATLEDRVASRLRWDRSLAEKPIQVRTVENGVIELQGTVADLSARRRAVDLAQSTVGVEQVIDAMEVSP
jgi:osmotically-inducible protein OsmY